MYRSPRTSSSGASGFLLMIFLLWGVVYLTGCADTVAGPSLGGGSEMDDPALEISSNPELADLLLDDVGATIGDDGNAATNARLQQAEALFADARVAFAAGDAELVKEKDDQAVIALAVALVESTGGRAHQRYLDRTRQLRDRLASRSADDEFDRPDAVRATVAGLVVEMEEAATRGDDVTAADRAVRANREADRDRTRRHDRDPEEGARFAVAMGLKAVDVAGRLLDEVDATEQQLEILENAARFAQNASEAMEAGEFGKATNLAQRAVSLSLLAVVGRDISHEDVATIQAMAEAELAAAAAADLTELERSYLARAQRAFELGVEKVANGELRGISLIWRAGVAAGVLAS